MSSPLGEFLSKLQIKLDKIRESRPVKEDDSVEKTYSDQQLAAIAQGFDFVMQTVLPIFDAGKAPSLFSTALLGMIKSGLSLSSLLPIFHTSEYAVYESIEKDLGAILTTCLDANKIQLFTPDNIKAFKAALKDEIKKQKEIRFAAATKIPGTYLDLIFVRLDVLIEEFDFTEYNQEKKINKKALIAQLSREIKLELVGWDDKLKAFKAPFQLKIADSGLYQLIVEFLLLVDSLPESLDACIPFLNPTALNLNLKSGIIAKLLSAGGLNPFQLASTSSEESSSAYCYNLSIGEDTTAFNGDEHYRVGLPQSRVFLYGLLKDYFANYGETSHVKSERAKAKLIQDFITKETDWLQNKGKPYRERYLALNENLPAEMAYEDKLNLLKQKMAAANALLLDIEQLIEGISNRKYQQQIFADLLAMHNMKGALAADAALRLDMSYADSALPATLIAEGQDKNFTVIPVQQTLQTQFFSTRNGLALLQKQINEQKLAFAQQEKGILQEWYEAEIKRHNQENELWLRRLEVFHIATSDALRLDEIATLDDDDNFDLRIQSINKQLESLSQHQEELKKYEIELEALQEQLNKPVSCPERLCQDDSTISEEAGRCYTTSKREMFLCVKQLHESAKLFENRRETLESQLRKAHAAKAFAETMRSSNPDVIEKLLSEKKDQLQVSLVAQEKLIQGLSERRRQQDEVEGEALKEDNLLLRLLKKRDAVIRSILEEIGTHSKQILTVMPGLDTYFDSKKLSSLAGIDAAQYCLNQVFERQMALENVEDSKNYQQRLTALNAAYNCIDTSNEKFSFNPFKEKFPFNSLASLPALQGIVAGKNKGFDALLNLLDDPGTTKAWLAYRTSAPREEILLQARKQLLELIDSKRESCKANIKARLILEEVQKDFLNAQDSLGLIHALMIPLPLLCEDIEKLITQRREREQKGDDLILAIKQEELNLFREETVAAVLTKDVGVLKQIVDLLKGCQELNQLVAEVEASDTEFGSADLLYKNQETINDRITKVVDQQGKLKLLLAKLAVDVNDLNDNTAYLANIETITALLNGSEQRILKFKEGIFGRKISDLQAQIQANKEAMAAMGKKFPAQEVGQEISLDVTLDGLNALLVEYSGFADASALIAERRQLIEKSCPESLSAQFILVNNSAKQLKVDNSQLLTNYLDQVEEILNEYDNELQTHSLTLNVVFDEKAETYKANKQTLGTVENYLNTFPEAILESLASTLENLKPASEAVLDKLETVSKASESLQASLADKQAINAQLNERIEARGRFALDFNQTLSHYLVQRNGKYVLKDYVLWTDGIAREQFVEHVQSALDTYVASGDSEPLFTYINSERAKFAGYKLQTILSQLLYELSEHDRKIPENYENDELESETLVIDHSQSLALLTALDAAGRNGKNTFVIAIKQLYIEIEKMQKHGENLGGLTDKQGKIVLDLTTALYKKVDGFVISNHGKELTQEAIESFQTNFIHMAHSQDEAMSKHASWWTPVLVNMAAAMATLGLAVGFQLAASKWLTGRFAFFYDRSAGLELVDAVDKAAIAIAAPAA